MLEVSGLSVLLGERRVLREISFRVARGETLGIVGESGSGKTVAALAIMGLLPPLMRASGAISLAGQALAGLAEAEYCRLRGRRAAMIFQEPMTALNPVMTIGRQIVEGLVVHGLMEGAAARHEATRLLERVGIAQASLRLDSYPHQLSGGQRQRAMIAMAIACRPALLIADEPTSALDVTVQTEILALLRELRDETGMGMLFISHDLGVVARVADRTLVLYGGAAMEEGVTRAVIAAPRNPYTRGLIAAIPRGNAHTTPLRPIRGHVPELDALAPGCPFHGRCPRGTDLCREVAPPAAPGATVSHCHYPEDGAPAGPHSSGEAAA